MIVCGKKLVLSFLCKDVYPFIFLQSFFNPSFIFLQPIQIDMLSTTLWGPTEPVPLGLPRGTGSPALPVKVSSGPRKQWLGHSPPVGWAPSSQTPCPEHPRGIQPQGLPEPLQKDLQCPQTLSDLESMLTCYCMKVTIWHQVTGSPSFAFSKLKILLMQGIRGEMGDWNGNKVQRVFHSGTAKLSPVLLFLLVFLEVMAKSEALA